MGICTAWHDMIVVEEYGEEYERCAQCGYIESEVEEDGDAMYDAMIDDMVASR
jgi:hypothetical protein